MRMRLQDNKIQIARCGLLLGTALVLSYIESTLGMRFALLPWMKIGLANVITAFAFFELSPREALIISLGRVIIMGILFGSPVSFLYSACGACLSFSGLLVSLCIKKHVSYIGISVLCACMHNFGQAAVAACFFGLDVTMFYLPYLILTGVLFGSITGSLLNILSPKIKKVIVK